MAGIVKTICETNVQPIIENLGYEVVEIEYVKKSDGMNLTFYIDKDGGIDIKDCELVSKTIDPILEQLNPTSDAPYILNVSSPGIDRPLKTKRDFERNQGKEIEITLFAKEKESGQKVFKGTLDSFDENSLTITNEKFTKTFQKSLIAHIVPVIKF